LDGPIIVPRPLSRRHEEGIRGTRLLGAPCAPSKRTSRAPDRLQKSMSGSFIELVANDPENYFSSNNSERKKCKLTPVVKSALILGLNRIARKVKPWHELLEGEMGIETFSDFYGHLHSATHGEYRTRRHAKVSSEKSFEAQKQHLLDLYKNVEVQHSFVDAAGQVFDCIPIDQQPALKKSGRPLATPPTLPIRHAPASPRAPILAPLHPDRRADTATRWRAQKEQSPYAASLWTR
jgi:hypothetical protein